MTRPVAIRSLTRVRPGQGRETDQDLLAVEAPLSVLIDDGRQRTPLGVLMRTPGHDEDLALGAVFSEGVINRPEDVAGVSNEPDTLVVTVTASADLSALTGRVATSTSACGLCGRLEVLAVNTSIVATPDRPRVRAATVATLPAALREAQAAFEATGGLHAAGLFSSAGLLDVLREDVGRHNAVDKVVGARLRAGRLPAPDSILVVSGRIAYEIVQKAARASIPVIVGIGAPTDLAVDAARSAGLTLIGFAKAEKFNIYTGTGRIED